MSLSRDGSSSSEYRVKVGLLGPEENYKLTFLNRISQEKLPNSHKDVIGVTVGGLKINSTHISPFNLKSLYISLWDIDCSANFSMTRVQYYRGSGVVLLFIDENTQDQALLYCEEIRQHDLTISIGLVFLHKSRSPREIPNHLNNSELSQMEHVDLQKPEAIISWIVGIISQKQTENIWQGSTSILFVPKVALLGNPPPAPLYHSYTPPIEYDGNLPLGTTLNESIIERFLRQMGITVQDRTSVVTNRFGEFRISLQNGSVQFTPRRCLHCNRGCPQRQNICIIACTRGFSSSPPLTQADMLVMAKIIALRSEELPNSVLEQISRSFNCHSHYKYLRSTRRNFR